MLNMQHRLGLVQQIRTIYNLWEKKKGKDRPNQHDSISDFIREFRQAGCQKFPKIPMETGIP